MPAKPSFGEGNLPLHRSAAADWVGMRLSFQVASDMRQIVGVNGGLLYLRLDEPAFGTLLDFHNLTALNPYYRATDTVPEPGTVGTDMQEADAAEQRGKIARHEMLYAEDVAEAVAFLLDRPARVDIVAFRIEPRMQELP